MAEAAASRPKIVGEALNSIAGQDAQVLDTVLSVMEIDNLLTSNAKIDIVPASSNLLVQMGASSSPPVVP
jgi:hypothetical protein